MELRPLDTTDRIAAFSKGMKSWETGLRDGTTSGSIRVVHHCYERSFGPNVLKYLVACQDLFINISDCKELLTQMMELPVDTPYRVAHGMLMLLASCGSPDLERSVLNPERWLISEMFNDFIKTPHENIDVSRFIVRAWYRFHGDPATSIEIVFSVAAREIPFDCDGSARDMTTAEILNGWPSVPIARSLAHLHTPAIVVGGLTHAYFRKELKMWGHRMFQQLLRKEVTDIYLAMNVASVPTTFRGVPSMLSIAGGPAGVTHPTATVLGGIFEQSHTPPSPFNFGRGARRIEAAGGSDEENKKIISRLQQELNDLRESNVGRRRPCGPQEQQRKRQAAPERQTSAQAAESVASMASAAAAAATPRTPPGPARSSSGSKAIDEVALRRQQVEEERRRAMPQEGNSWTSDESGDED